jgi:hypothetical protein
MPIILATQEAEIRRITVQSQPRQIVLKSLSQKTLHKSRAGGMAQGEGPEFKHQHHKKKKNSVAGCQWLTPIVVLAIQEAEIRRITVQGQLGQQK